MIKILAIALALTLAIELLFARLWGVRDREDMKIVALANILTNPAVNCFALLAILRGALRVPAIAMAEIVVVAVEWGVYRNCSAIRRPLLFALLANGASFALGQLLQMLI